MPSKIIPAGVPPWTRTTDFSHYGGNANKQNYLSRGPIDALTDVGADEFARMTNDLAAVARTNPFCVLAFGALVGDVRVVSSAQAMFGVRTVAYETNAEPPGLFPRVDRNGIGNYTIAFLEQYTDSYGVVAPFAVTGVKPGCAVHPAVCRVVAEIVDAHRVRVRAFDAGGTAIDPEGGISGCAIF